jgi:hypothetical protein
MLKKKNGAKNWLKIKGKLLTKKRNSAELNNSILLRPYFIHHYPHL